MEMQLTEQETSLLQAIRRLQPDTAAQLSALAEQLASISAASKIDWSDSWSDEDIEDFTAAAIRRLEAEEAEE